MTHHFQDKQAAIDVARTIERETDRAQYVVCDLSNGCREWVTTDKMPMMGVEWYTSDGIRHG